MGAFSYTRSLKRSDVEKPWVVIDAGGVVLGRLASYVADLLRGKGNPMYTPHVDCGSNVIIINADRVRLTGSKLRNKVYYRHTGYIGGIKSDTPERLLSSGKGFKIIKMAVWGMLGDGPMARRRFSNLYIYSGPDHKHAAQKAVLLDFLSMSKKNGG